MKPSTNRRDLHGRLMGGRSPGEMGPAGRAVGLGHPADIPPYLFSPEGLEAPLPEVTELPTGAPVARKGLGAPVPPLLRSGPLAHGNAPRHGHDPHGFKRHASVAPLREHRVHGRGQ